MKIHSLYAWILSFTLLMSCNALAAPLVAQTTDNGIEYVMGGIGVDEAATLDTLANQYPLRLMFSQGQCGHSIAGVTVDIYDVNKNVVFHLDHAEPQLLIKLQKGRYHVVADYQGLKQGHRFSLNGNRHQKVVLHWKDCVDDEAGEGAHL